MIASAPSRNAWATMASMRSTTLRVSPTKQMRSFASVPSPAHLLQIRSNISAEQDEAARAQDPRMSGTPCMSQLEVRTTTRDVSIEAGVRR